MMRKLSELIVLVKGGGEVASGIAHRLHRSHFRVCLTEIASPLAVSRGTSFSEAVFEGVKSSEGVTAELVSASLEEIYRVWQRGNIPIMIDPKASIRHKTKPDVVVDATMAKRNLGTKITDAPLVIGLGPGFQAERDVHVVVETNNTENLGKVITEGEAEKDTGIPIAIGDLTFERVLHSSGDGLFLAYKQIGDFVSAGEMVASVAGHPVKAEIGGVVRALLRSGIEVGKGTKLGEIDPSGYKEVCYTIRARVRAIAGGVLEAILMRFNV